MKLKQVLCFLISTAFGMTLAVCGARAEALPVDISDEESCVRYALAHNLDLRAARWEQDIADAELSRASAISNPVARGEWLHVQRPGRYGWGVGLEWAPPQPGVYNNYKGRARAGARAAKADFSERTADLVAGVRIGYASVAALAEEIALAEKSLATRRAVQRVISDRVSHGASSRIDLTLASVSLARAEQAYALMTLARAAEVARLEVLLGLPDAESLAMAVGTNKGGAPEITPPAAGAGGEALELRALAQRQLLMADAARADAADFALAAEQGKRWPWLALQGRYRRNDQANYVDDVTLGVEVTLPIFDRNPGPIAAAQAARGRARDLALAHRSGVVREVRALRAENARRRDIAEHYAQTINPVLAEHAGLVKQALAGREVDLTALLAAEDVVTRGGIDYLEARLEQRKAEIALARAVGEYQTVAAPGNP